MNAKVYNIIWADDDIVSLEKDESTRTLFYNNGIKLLEGVTTSERLRQALDTYKDKVDAVIIDANFSRDDVEYLQDDDISGLIHSATLVELYNIKREIPFFLYTARKGKLSNLCTNQELLYFEKNERIFLKGDIKPLIYRIMEDVLRIQSIEWWVQQRYGKLLDKVKEIDEKAAVNLEDFLRMEARDINFDKAKDMFNSLRKIIENIEDRCHNELIIPEAVSSLNAFAYFWSKDGYKQKEVNGRTVKTIWKPKSADLMPKLLSESLTEVIKILQDGSHATEKLELHVTEYVQEKKTPFVFRYCLHYVLEILMWFSDLESKLDTSEKYMVPLYKEESPTYSRARY